MTTEIKKLREKLEQNLRIEFGNPSNSLAIANDKLLIELNRLEREAGTEQSVLNGFCLV
jgi:hypothetical protein